MKKVFLIIAIIVSVIATLYLIEPLIPDDIINPVNPVNKDNIDKNLTQQEIACTDSGGVVSSAMCCESAGDFPDTCAIGACGCAPEYSHEVKICDCGEGKCFDRDKCVDFAPSAFKEKKKPQPQPEPKPEPEPEPGPKVTLCSMSIGNVAKTELLSLAPWTDGAVALDVPVGWNVYTGGECATKSILARDPLSELKQVFYFSEAGPVYTSQERKTWDYNYIQMGGDISWFDAPIVDPLTAENYLTNFSTLALTSFFQQVFPQVPVMTNVKIISSVEITNKPNYITDAKLVRAEFQQNNKAGEGYFYIVTSDIGMDWGYGMMFTGITAPKGLLDLITPSLKKSLGSYTISQEYVSSCIDADNKAAVGALKTGKILSKTSNTIMDVWENKLESEQRMSEKYTSATLGQSRLYNADMDEVYEVTPEFYDHYQAHDNEFEMNYLEELPDDKWDYVPLNGAEHIR